MLRYYYFFELTIWNNWYNIILDIDECLTNNGGCHSNANCENSQGNFICTCKEGYSGNGINCDGMI